MRRRPLELQKIPLLRSRFYLYPIHQNLRKTSYPDSTSLPRTAYFLPIRFRFCCKHRMRHMIVSVHTEIVYESNPGDVLFNPTKRIRCDEIAHRFFVPFSSNFRNELVGFHLCVCLCLRRVRVCVCRCLRRCVDLENNVRSFLEVVLTPLFFFQSMVSLDYVSATTC